MIERQIIAQKMKEKQVEEFIFAHLNKASYSHTELQRTPLGEKIIIYTSRPGMVVGRRGSNIQDLTILLKKKFNMENPQIEVSEIPNPSLNANSVAKRIVSSFERFGPKRFKSVGYKVLDDIIHSGALGAEIVISGRGVPSTRAKSWRFSAGYLKKSGDISQNFTNYGFAVANLRSGSIGIKVKILRKEVRLPDQVFLKEDLTPKVEPIAEAEQIKEIEKEIAKEVKKPKAAKKIQEKKPVKEVKKEKSPEIKNEV
ncbi:30S ribosomal protein S3 [Candidatus Woesearchaeota archaeon]|nr:30S ribosomal protein S3 [Candidatus Woesearchaeota archaeon]